MSTCAAKQQLVELAAAQPLGMAAAPGITPLGVALVPPAAPTPVPRRRWLHHLARLFLFFNFLPMILVAVLAGSSGVLLAFGVAAAIPITSFLLSIPMYRAGVFQTWPKWFDLANMVLYLTALPVAATHPAWMDTWRGAWTTAGTLAFMVLTLVVRRPFACESAYDKLPRPTWGLPAVSRMCWAISCWWTACLAVMSAAAIAAAVLGHVKTGSTADILCNYVLGIAPIGLGLAGQHLMVWRMGPGLRTDIQQHMAGLAAAGRSSGAGAGGAKAADEAV